MSTLYFAYGSNMDPQEIGRHCRSAHRLGAARLDGFRLAFTRRSIRSGSGVADVVRDGDQVVWGVLYELHDGDLKALDAKEGLGWAYTRRREPVVLGFDGSRHEAHVYTVLLKEQDPVPPAREYLERMIAAGTRNGLPASYISMLGKLGRAGPTS